MKEWNNVAFQAHTTKTILILFVWTVITVQLLLISCTSSVLLPSFFFFFFQEAPRLNIFFIFVLVTCGDSWMHASTHYNQSDLCFLLSTFFAAGWNSFLFTNPYGEQQINSIIVLVFTLHFVIIMMNGFWAPFFFYRNNVYNMNAWSCMVGRHPITKAAGWGCVISLLNRAKQQCTESFIFITTLRNPYCQNASVLESLRELVSLILWKPWAFSKSLLSSVRTQVITGNTDSNESWKLHSRLSCF